MPDARRVPTRPCLAVDIGATKLAVRFAGPAGSWQAAAPWPEGGVPADLAQLRRMITRALAEAGGSVDRVGVASAPTVATDGTVVAWPSRPSWVGVRLLETVTYAAGAEAAAADDGCLAALAEAEAADCADLAYLGLGTGVSGGLVAGGRLLRGATGAAGQLGHLPVETPGRRCRCGRRGCLQAGLTGAALAARASEVRGRSTTTYDLARAAAVGRPWARRVVDEAAALLSHAVLVVAELTDPTRVHIGGGLGAALPMLPARVTALLRPRNRAGRELPLVAPAGLGAFASLAGAMLLAEQPELLG